MTTVNISLPQSMYEDAKKMLAKNRYASISELVRDALRKVMYQDVTENGFTQAFEDKVLKAATEPLNDDVILETEEDIDKFFNTLNKNLKKKKYDKD